MSRFGNAAVVTPLALVLLLAPLIAALPDETLADQPFWSAILSTLVMLAAILAVWQAGRKGPTPAHSSPPLAVPAGQSLRPKRERKRRESRQASHSSRKAVGGREALAQPAEAEATRAVSPPEAGGVRRSRGVGSSALLAFAVLLGLALLSLLWRLVAQHGTAYLGLMLRGWATLATEFVLFALCLRLARADRAGTYAVVLTVVGAATVAALKGVAERLMHGLAGDWGWRVFSTSTPDFLAGYLVMTLPVTVALFGAAVGRRDRSPVFGLLWGLILLAQIVTLLGTGSRFGLISLVVGAVVYALAVRRTRTQETTGPRDWRRPAAVAVVVLLVGLLAARPVAGRLMNLHDNSTLFRLWTWRGAAKMAAANPILGTGIGAWVDQYPRYALTGFTRLAHNSYIQMADECGLPALLALLATLGFVGVAGWRGLSAPLPSRGTSQPWVEPVAPADDRSLLTGLLVGLAAGAVQNLIDSDWYVFFLGTTFWALAGLAVGLAGRNADEVAPASPPSRMGRLALGGAAGALLVWLGTQAVGAFYNGQAQRASDIVGVQFAYAQAMAWDPLNGRYPSDLGFRVYYRQAKDPNADDATRTDAFNAAEANLRRAAALEPSGQNFYRLGRIEEAQAKPAEALAAYLNAVRLDPNSLDALLGAARLSPPEAALALYLRVAALEDSPVGTVRAIGELTEYRFASADAALGFDAARRGDADSASHFFERAARRLEIYANEGGTTNPMRQVLIGYQPSPDQDRDLATLYTQVMKAWVGVAAPDRKTELDGRAQAYGQRFRAILAQDYATLGDAALAGGHSPEAEADFTRAAEFLEGYADAGGSQAPQRQGFTGEKADPKADADMAKLYEHVMQRLLLLTPPEGQAALQERARRYEAKFAALFPRP